MSAKPQRSTGRALCGAVSQSTPRLARRALALALAAAPAALAALPAAAQAHGPLAPVATSYLGRISSVPPGVQAKVIDGYLRLWMRVPRYETLVVLDYRGAPYLRFARSGVYVNEHSEMYYLNLMPSRKPPRTLSPHAPPRWRRVSSAHEYSWHDGRIGALSATALAPGASYVGRWSISLLLDGRLSSVSGGLWHAQSPSLDWLWAIAVLIACLLAAWRLGRPALDRRLGRALTVAVLAAIAAGAAARWLHGRPGVPIDQALLVGALGLFAAWGMFRILLRPDAVLLYCVTAALAVWMGFELSPVLLHGFVLAAMPPFATRAIDVICLGGGLGLALFAVRIFSSEPQDDDVAGAVQPEQLSGLKIFSSEPQDVDVAGAIRPERLGRAGIFSSQPYDRDRTERSG